MRRSESLARRAGIMESGSMIDWSKQEAPTLAEFDAIADAAYRRLPTRFRALTGDLLIRIEDFATDEVRCGADRPLGLGLRQVSEVPAGKHPLPGDVSALPD